MKKKEESLPWKSSSTEPSTRPDEKETEDSCLYHYVCPPNTKRKCTDRSDIPGSTSFVPPVAGTLIAYQVQKTWWKQKKTMKTKEKTIRLLRTRDLPLIISDHQKSQITVS